MSDVAMIVDDVVEDLLQNFEPEERQDDEIVLIVCKLYLFSHDSALSGLVLLHEVKKTLNEMKAA